MIRLTRRKTIFTTVFWFLLGCSLPVTDAFGRNLFDVWTTDNGLPQNSVYSILQTRDGYLWFTTLNGLVRHDGVRFSVFDKGNSPGIRSNRFTTLFEDKAGNLWIGTEDAGLTRYTNNVFTTFAAGDNPHYNSVRAIEDDKDGGLWIFTEGGIARWENEQLTPQPWREITRFHTGIETKLPGLLKESQRNSGMSFADPAGLHLFADGHLTTYTTRNGLSSLKINSLYRDGGGNLWVGTEDAGLNRLRDGKFTIYNVKDNLLSDHTRVSAVSEDREGSLWIARVGMGLSQLKNGVLTTYTPADGLPSLHIEIIYEDREGSLWIGTSDKGISRLREKVITVHSKQDGLSAANVYPIYEDRAGNVWVGAWSGLNKYKDGRFTTYTKENGLSSDTITALAEDRDGHLWIGTYGGGVNRFKDGRFTALTTRDNLNANGVLAILQDREGTFWFGTTSGLYRYRNGKLALVTMNNGLPHPAVTAIVEDQQGRLWFGTRSGLTRLEAGQFTRYTETEGLSSDNVRAIYEDADGVLWIGTYDNGLNRFEDERITRYTTKEGLFDNGVFQILEDNRNNLWMSCNRGIYRVSHRELNEFAAGERASVTSVSYGIGDGMLSAECNGGSQPAGAKTRDGKLWFPTQEGVAVINPELIRTNELPPPVQIEEFAIENEKISFEEAVQIAPGQERFEISYTALSFIKPEQVRFKFMLEGLDRDWVDAGSRRTANYSYVPPGSYTFKVIAANSDGVWNTEGQSLRITVIPPFYQRWWFIALGALGLISFSFLIYRRRIAQLEREKQAQETISRRLIEFQENERKRLASELHDGLSQNLVIIKNRAMMSLNSPDDVAHAFEQIEEIAEAATESLAEVRELAHNLRPFQIDRLGFTKAIEALAKKANSQALRVTTQLDKVDAQLTPEAEINFYRIVQEALNNIIKHSAASRATITIVQNEKDIEMTVQDNGKGFNADAARIGQSNDGGGLGLAGIFERARIMGGTPQIESTPGKGTIIRLKIAV